MKDNAGSLDGPLVTGSEIARLAGVTRAAVSNWRRRYDDFPAQAGGAANSPLYALAEVQAWLDRQRKGQEVSPEVELWQAMRAAYGEQMVAGLAEVAGMLVGEQAAGLPDEVSARVRTLARAEAPVDLVNGLTERFMDSARRAGSDQVTSERVVRAVCHFAPELPAAATVFDPACGIGALLLSVAAEAGTHRRGQEVDADSARFAQLRAGLLDRPDARIVAGDSLREDGWPDLKADLVVCDPPTGVTEWGREELLLDSRWELGTPSKAEGELAWLQHAYAHTDAGGQVTSIMALVQDVSAKIQIARQQHYLANHDSLTGLLNRAAFQRQLEQSLDLARNGAGAVALLFIDLDGFKGVNDTEGHRAGDEVLRIVARRMAGTVRAGDTLARLGGDEFLVMLDRDVTREVTDMIGHRLLEALQQPMTVEGRDLFIGASIGIAVHPPVQGDIDDLMNRADQAMYSAKRAGKGRLHYAEAACS